MTGTVYLVGAGPGDAGLITLRAAELVRCADVILYDRLVNKKILEMASKEARRIYVGREVGDDTSHQDSTNRLMAEHAEAGSAVVRLKGGDPMIFGRGGEEAEYLRSRDIPYEIVPGITSGIGSATYSGIPLTHRRYASSVAFVTGHEDPEKGDPAVRWRNLAGSVDTIVIMMGLSAIGEICRQLVEGGMDERTPVAVIQDGTTENHKMITGDLAGIAGGVRRSGIKPPANIIIGRVVDLSKEIGWR